MSIPTPIMEAIVHPPIGFLKRSLIGSVTGSGDLTKDDGKLPPFNHVNAYGLTWDATTIPAGMGRLFGSPTIYEQRLLQASTVHEGADGHELVSEYHDFFVEGIYWLWENAGPSRVHYEVTPGVVLTLFWLVVQFP